MFSLACCQLIDRDIIQRAVILGDVILRRPVSAFFFVYCAYIDNLLIDIRNSACANCYFQPTVTFVRAEFAVFLTLY